MYPAKIKAPKQAHKVSPIPPKLKNNWNILPINNTIIKPNNIFPNILKSFSLLYHVNKLNPNVIPNVKTNAWNTILGE